MAVVPRGHRHRGELLPIFQSKPTATVTANEGVDIAGEHIIIIKSKPTAAVTANEGVDIAGEQIIIIKSKPNGGRAMRA
jgi:UTP-glucose-1-phosphate uridylyltransferase